MAASSQQQPRILNRVSGFFMHHAKKKQASDEETSSSNSSSDEISLPPAPSTHDGASSRVDSMFSSISSVRGNPNSPPPVRTVRLDNPVVHESPPSPPSISSRKKSKQKLDPKQVDEAFDRLLQEYALASNIRPTLTQLTTEQKSMLLQSSKSRMLLRKNSTFSSSSSAAQFFAPLASTFGIKKKQPTPQIPFFSPDSPSPSPSPPLEQQFQQQPRASPPSRRRHSNADKSNSVRSKLKSSPEYFVHLLKDTSVRELDFADVVDLRVFLRNVVVSWTTEFLALGGYEALGDKFRQMKELPKRMPQDDRILQQLTKCFKAIMTHEANGTEKVLTNPAPLYYIRDLLFGPTNQKLKAVYGLHISTRAELLGLLCTLPSLQVTTASGRYVHGYDVLRKLLLDQPTDQPEEPVQKSYPFPMTLKADPQTVMRMILDEDGTARTTPVAPRYTAWMREIQHTVDKHIEPITFLAQVLDYNFESAFKQLKIRSQQQQQQQQQLQQKLLQQDQASAHPVHESSSSDAISPGLVMVDEGVVDYLITHLRLICTLVTTPPTNFRGTYNEYEQEKMRLEIMLSGFDKISKALQTCPHPTLYASYIRYLQPLLQPWADLAIPTTSSPTNTITQLAAPQQQHIRQERAWRQQTIRSLSGNYQRDMLRWEQDLRAMDTTIVHDDERPAWMQPDDDDDMWEDMDDNFDDIFNTDDDEDDDDDGEDEYGNRNSF